MSKFNEEERARLQGFFSLLLKAERRILKEKLMEHPQGFWVKNGPWECGRCWAVVDEAWYNAEGATCLACKKTLLCD